MNIRSCLAAGALLLASLPVLAHEYEAGNLLITHPWTRATPPGGQAGGVFLTIKNSGEADQLIAARADVSAEAGLHQMKLDNGVMKMTALPQIDIPAKGELQLKPGSYHIMLDGLKAPLKEGGKFPLTLVFKRAGEVKVSVKVESISAKAEDIRH
ncbi:hypothetical protein IGB42_01439 [Andreprevotia sp. IGB-42]|uniref:copper chaperone PCu(A)C n=1 Tax=Andreprevotia sp. IGB-42 TaxID=2497473 RepID=UPI00135725BA|nr:copper chaperone PCu(A)C [Andreprevotia sp. IGB-42]KAF0813760.1 hypothetical protein IGB42_01439 [Andreprevotia sp. IGB-42]